MQALIKKYEFRLSNYERMRKGYQKVRAKEEDETKIIKYDETVKRITQLIAITREMITDLQDLLTYDTRHYNGHVTIEQTLEPSLFRSADLGIKITKAGRVWICLNGQALLRLNNAI